jgi:hypothetical protein
MEITTRKEAAKRNLKKYFTGKPCSNGHVAERYTQSGSCQACIQAVSKVYAATNSQDRETKAAAMREVSDARQAAVATMSTVKVRCFVEDIRQIKQLAVVLMKNRYPFLPDECAGIDRAGTHGDAGTILLKLELHADDVAFMQDTARVLMNARPVDVAAERRRIHGVAVAAMIDSIAAPAPEFIA